MRGWRKVSSDGWVIWFESGKVSQNVSILSCTCRAGCEVNGTGRFDYKEGMNESELWKMLVQRRG